MDNSDINITVKKCSIAPVDSVSLQREISILKNLHGYQNIVKAITFDTSNCELYIYQGSTSASPSDAANIYLEYIQSDLSRLIESNAVVIPHQPIIYKIICGIH